MKEEEIKKLRKFYRKRGFKKKTIDELILVYKRARNETEIF